MSPECVIEGGFRPEPSLIRQHQERETRVLQIASELLDLSHPGGIYRIEEVHTPSMP
jgi:hypothetical protein